MLRLIKFERDPSRASVRPHSQERFVIRSVLEYVLRILRSCSVSANLFSSLVNKSSSERSVPAPYTYLQVVILRYYNINRQPASLRGRNQSTYQFTRSRTSQPRTKHFILHQSTTRLGINRKCCALLFSRRPWSTPQSQLPRRPFRPPTSPRRPTFRPPTVPRRPFRPPSTRPRRLMFRSSSSRKKTSSTSSERIRRRLLGRFFGPGENIPRPGGRVRRTVVVLADNRRTVVVLSEIRSEFRVRSKSESIWCVK